MLGRVIEISESISGQEVSQQFEYDVLGNQIKAVDEKGNITSYQYDSMNRLTTIIDPMDNITYSYDAVGNRETMVDESGEYTSDQPSGYIDVVTEEAVQYRIKKSDYVYTNANKLVKLVEKLENEKGEEVLQKTTSYQYDANGNEVRQAVSYILPHNRQMRQSTTGDIHGDHQTEEINYLVEKVNSQFDGFNRLKEIEKIKEAKGLLSALPMMETD